MKMNNSIDSWIRISTPKVFWRYIPFSLLIMGGVLTMILLFPNTNTHIVIKPLLLLLSMSGWIGTAYVYFIIYPKDFSIANDILKFKYRTGRVRSFKRDQVRDIKRYSTTDTKEALYRFESIQGFVRTIPLSDDSGRVICEWFKEKQGC